MEKNIKKYCLIAAFVLFFLGGIVYITLSRTEEIVNYEVPSPKDVVVQYFTAWNNKNYPDMYSTLSDGFKKIDPNAKDLTIFRNFASSQGIMGINILSVNEVSNDGTTALVDYSVEFILENNTKKFEGTFTLKYREGDVIKGWKLIHPYGNNIDTT